METAKGWDDQDIRMETARGLPDGGAGKNNAGRPPPLKLWEREVLETAEVRRKATVAQLCEW